MEHSNLGVRRLLRKLRHPGMLERDHYAVLLRNAVKSTSARDALLTLLHDVLRQYPAIYWTVIKRIDVDGEPAKRVAEELFLSYRTLHRYRSAAISAIADALDNHLGRPPASLEERLRQLVSRREHAGYAQHLTAFFSDPNVRVLLKGR